MNILNENCYKQTKYVRIATDIAEKLYFYAQWAGHFTCKRDFYIKRNNMKSYLLIYTVNGSGILNCDNSSYKMKKNSIAFIDCRQTHEYFPVDDGWDFKFIHFYGRQSREYYELITMLYNSPVFLCDGPETESYFDKICDDVKNLKPEEQTSLTIYKILIGIISQKRRTADGFGVSAVMDYISEHYSENINVSDIAKAFNFSRSYFTAAFSRKYGRSPYAYLSEYRISAAKELLSSTNLSVEEIAYKCGFNSTSAFIRTFGQKECVTPLAYRKNMQALPD